jgi:signal transduction histidine kinase
MPFDARVAKRLHDVCAPRRTVRMRLTVLYASLFLASGAILLTIAYVLVLRSVPHGVLFARRADGAVLVGRSELGVSPDARLPAPRLLGGFSEADAPLIRERARELRAHAIDERATDLRLFLIQSGIVLALMTAMSAVLGWIVAGRVLRPLRMITRTAQDISANNLNARLALTGPKDELTELGDTIDGLLARLEKAFQSQRQFVANAAHELRTPLARQRTLIQVAVSDPAATAESLRAAHERVLAANRQQQRLIDTLLTLARSESGLDRREPFDLSHVTEHVLSAREQDARRRQLHLSVTLDPAPIAGDPRLVECLVANLVDNAVRHNHVSGHIDVHTRTTKGMSVLFLANSGPLIPPSVVDRLFQPFQRLSEIPGRAAGGLGLGLSIVQAVAVAHDATVTARPRSEGGLEISVVFLASTVTAPTDGP